MKAERALGRSTWGRDRTAPQTRAKWGGVSRVGRAAGTRHTGGRSEAGILHAGTLRGAGAREAGTAHRAHRVGRDG